MPKYKKAFTLLHAAKRSSKVMWWLTSLPFKKSRALSVGHKWHVHGSGRVIQLLQTYHQLLHMFHITLVFYPYTEKLHIKRRFLLKYASVFCWSSLPSRSDKLISVPSGLQNTQKHTETHSSKFSELHKKSQGKGNWMDKPLEIGLNRD